MNYETARYHMIEQQLRTWNVLDPAVVDALYADRREEFVPAAHRALAFADIAIPLGQDAVMLAPKFEARALQALAPQPHEHVLEIGTGTGHMAALLAARAQSVVSVEIDPGLAEQARANFVRRGIENVQVVVADGLVSRVPQGPFDAILVSGGLNDLPAVLVEQLKVGGRLVGFFAGADTPVMMLRRLTRRDVGVMAEDVIEATVPMLRQPLPSQFRF